jgi:hypothetical protein
LEGCLQHDGGASEVRMAVNKAGDHGSALEVHDFPPADDFLDKGEGFGGDFDDGAVEDAHCFGGGEALIDSDDVAVGVDGVDVTEETIAAYLWGVGGER